MEIIFGLKVTMDQVNGKIWMCKKEKLPFLEHSNINPKAHLNKSRIHLNRNGSEKLGKNFVDFIVNHYA